ncbi:Aspartate aminotransferase [Nitrincola lacisaponensis]|uniref:Aminotransferase n=1 Tax=Nitrincola lacisaponensis TaxID=267850 RepID=A0A063XWW1_9GAMM|nr:pyridoxal phosphate-dependent aminotransferase [Nitrincola lacisaponensis]KDE38703.1 Aspartate aminotransferase [Nitrincola lacisaponensis]
MASNDTKSSRRAASIESFKVMDLLKRARELEAAGCDVVHLEVGEPDFATAEPVAEAAIQAVRAGLTQYTPASGIPELRERIAAFYDQRYGVQISPEQVLVTPGASGALLLAFASLVDAGQRIMTSDPGYPCNRQFLHFLNASAQLVPTGPAEKFQLTNALIAEHWQPETRGVLLASPSNPTGTLVPVDEMQAIAQRVRQLGGQLIVDELYHGLTYGVDAMTALQVDPECFVVNSFSKYFGMTGWRLGWLVAPEGAIKVMERMAQNLFISPPTVSQYAALAAFTPQSLEIFEARRAAFEGRRDFLVQGLRDLGFAIPAMPEGAFYVYADASHLTDDSFAFCWSLLEENHIAVTPGADFGQFNASRYVRFSYTTRLDQIEKALQRLAQRIRG